MRYSCLRARCLVVPRQGEGDRRLLCHGLLLRQLLLRFEQPLKQRLVRGAADAHASIRRTPKLPYHLQPYY